MKTQNKWMSGAIAVTMLVSMLTLPQTTHAQTKKFDRQAEMSLVEKHEAMLEMKPHEAQLLTSLQRVSAAKKAQVNSADVTNATTVTYTGMTTPTQLNYYSFEVVTGGFLTVTANTTKYFIQNINTGVMVSSGQVMDPGFYVLVLPRTGIPSNYSVQLDGVTFNGTPDTTLPTLNVTSLTDYSSRLSKGEKSFPLVGSVTGANTFQYWLNDFNQDPAMIPVAADNTFNTTVNVQSGYNTILVEAESSTANGINEKHVVFSPSVERMAGANRYATSVEISKHLPVLGDTVVIATGTNFPDALSGGPLAAWYGAPILLTAPTGLSAEVKQEITRRHATHAIILGGTGVVPTAIEGELTSLGASVERIAGANRFETSANITNKLLNAQDKVGGEHSSAAFIVTGLGYADALAASAPAGRYGEPILLVQKTSIPTQIQTLIQNQHLFVFDIAGGTGVVSSSVEQQLKVDAARWNGTVFRYAGANRYETALSIAQTFSNPSTFTDPSLALDPTTMHIANGGNFPDALSQGPLASTMHAPLLLTKTAALEPSVETFLAAVVRSQAFFISGGTGAVSTNVENQLNACIPQ